MAKVQATPPDPSPAKPRPAQSPASAWPWLALAGLAVAAFGQVGGFGFVRYDDDHYVYQNPQVIQGLSWQTVQWAFSGAHYGNYNPLTWLSHLLDVTLFALEPAGHHLHNLALHLVNSLLVLAILRRHLGLGVAWLVAASFAVHPQHVESVAWVSDRKDLLAGLWGLLTVALYVRWTALRSEAGTGKHLWYLLAWLAFAASLLSKASGATLPVVLLLLDLWPLGRGKELAPAYRKLVAEKAPFLVLSVLFLWVTHRAQLQLGAVAADSELSLPLRLGNATVAVATYATKMLWPSNLAVHYPHPGPALQWPLVAACMATLLALCLLAWRVRRVLPAVTVGWFAYLVLVAPVAGVVQLGSFARADRFVYLPMLPLLVAIFGLLRAAVARWPLPPRVVQGAGMLAVVGQASVTLAILPAWQDTESLMRRAVAVTQANAVAHFDLGMALEAKGDASAALAHYRLAYLANPLDARANTKLGNLAMEAKELQQALRFYQTAQRSDPADLGIAANLTIAQEMAGELAQAESGLRVLLQRQPKDGAARLRLAGLLLRQRRAQEAEALYAAALAQDSMDPLASDGLGNALWAQGKAALARQHWQNAHTLAAQAGAAELRAALLGKLKRAQAATAADKGIAPAQPLAAPGSAGK